MGRKVHGIFKNQEVERYRPGPVGGVGCISGGISIPVIFTYPRVSSFRIRMVYGACPGTKYDISHYIKGYYYWISLFCIEMYRGLKMALFLTLNLLLQNYIMSSFFALLRRQ